MKSRLLLIALLLAAPFALLKAEDKVSHRLLVTDYVGNRVCIVSASGGIEWEHPATTPQDCWLLANGNVLFSQISGAVEVTRHKKLVWEFADHTRFKTVCQVQVIDTPADPLKGEVWR